jgi:hypothetical protein
VPGCGDSLGPYTLLRSLGGHVFEAAGPGGERLALKVIPSLGLLRATERRHDAQAERRALRASFLDDLSAVTGLTHPNLASVLDGELDHDYGWVVWPFFEGDTLAARRRGGQTFGDEQIETITAAVNAAAAALHAAGLGHGGITPTNVLLVDDRGRDRVILTETGSFPALRHGPAGDRVSRHTDDRATTRDALFGPTASAPPASAGATIEQAPPASPARPHEAARTSIFELANTSRKRPDASPDNVEALETMGDSDRSSPTIAPSRRPSKGLVSEVGDVSSRAPGKLSTSAPSATSERGTRKLLDETDHPTDRRVVIGLLVALGVGILLLWWQRSVPPAPHGTSPPSTLAAAALPTASAPGSAVGSAPRAPQLPPPPSAPRP